MSSEKKVVSSFNIAIIAIFTALVAVATIIFSIYVPATRGFFNVGESMVYLSAILFGPYVGAFAGGVGSMMADLYLGYPLYAPATLIIKACEGYIVGIMLKRSNLFDSVIRWKQLTVAIGIISGLLLGLVGTNYYSGEVELYFGSVMIVQNIPGFFWIILSFLLAGMIIFIGLKSEPKIGWTIISMFSGGIVMVLGYYLYQQFLIGPLFNIEVIAIADIPNDRGQMIIGTSIAIPISKVIKQSLPSLFHE